jgi:hypothetical protein
MPLDDIKREYGRDLTLWGCMPVQSALANGQPDDVDAWMAFLRDHVFPGGGAVLNFINMVVTPRVLDNLKRFFEIFPEQGAY